MRSPYYCIDCVAESQHFSYEFRKTSPPRCPACGGTLESKQERKGRTAGDMVKKAASTETPSVDNFPPHVLHQKADGSCESESIAFHVSRWSHLDENNRSTIPTGPKEIDGDVVIDRESLHDLLQGGTGINSDQCRLLGVKTPLESGWRRDLVGRRVSKSKYALAVRLRGVKRSERPAIMTASFLPE